MRAVQQQPTQAPTSSGWSASLKLTASRRGERTVLSRNAHSGPLRVQRPFYPEGGICHVYVLHPPGGLVAGDELDINVHCESASQLLLTTPSAGRVYCSNRQRLVQTQTVNIRVDAGARCEWLPQESIVFDRAEAVNRLSVSLAEGAQFNAWEVTCLGRPASGELFEGGQLQQRWDIYREDRPLFLERANFVGGSEQLQAAWGLGGATVVGTLVTTCDESLVEQLRTAIEALSKSGVCKSGDQSQPFNVPLFAVTALPELVVVRAFAQSGADVKNAFIALWYLLRQAQSGQTGVAPRIWFT